MRTVVFQPQCIDLRLTLVNNNHPFVELTQAGYEVFGYIVIAEDEDERFIDLRDIFDKFCPRDLFSQHFILYQCDNRTDTVKPADNRQID